jgi:hypothetical protein
MTPFELSLENDLHIEWQRFANDWLFKWHGMTYDGGVTDVDDFRGGRIHYRGIKFGHQQQQVFWEAVERYLIHKVHEIFKRWETETAVYPAEIRLPSIDRMERHCNSLCTGLFNTVWILIAGYVEWDTRKM